MPGFDGTGPRGMGPMTGGGRGFCNPYSPTYGMGAGYSQGFGLPAWGGRGRGLWFMGRGRGMGYPYAPSPYGGGLPYTPNPYGAGFAPGYGQEQELDMLKSQADMLSQQMEQINSRISELEKEASE